MNRTTGRLFLLCVAGITASCASGSASGPATTMPASSSAQQPANQQKPLIPAGLGTLHQDEFTVGLRVGALQVKVTPLAETVIRTGAPDTYNRLHRMAETRQAEALRAAAPNTVIELFLVSFFSNEQNTAFQPENLQLIHQGRNLRAVSILPITPGWGRQQLVQQQQQSAIYVFAADFDYELPMTVRYGQDQSDDWSRILARLQVERQKILSRAKTD